MDCGGTRPAALSERVVARCVDELGRAILYRRALRGLYEAHTDHGIDFVRLSSWALHDQIFAHAIKVLSPREQAGLWYLVKRYKKETSEICVRHSISLGHVRGITKGLLHIRNKTHFHLDARGVRDPKKIWRTADISWKRLDEALDAGFRVLCHLHRVITGAHYELPCYDGLDATRILTLADHTGLFCNPLEHNCVVTYVSIDGFWLRTREGEQFLAFWKFPWFRDAPVGQLLNVKEATPGHYCWPDLDVVLSQPTIRNPDRYPFNGKFRDPA